MLQEGFAKEWDVSVSIINHGKTDKTKPNFIVIKEMKFFCLTHTWTFILKDESWMFQQGIYKQGVKVL